MEVRSMKMAKLLIQVPQPIKAKLDALRSEGYTASGYIRALLERELKHVPTGPKGR
jgi:mannitol/fructose-specific phosphotransferase system IIA component